MSVASPELVRWLADLRHKIGQTDPEFSALNPVGWPIPFFGDVRTARVLTIGVNPSPAEFTAPRWDTVKTESDWIHRLLNYFHTPGVPWHDWFLPWEASLKLIGCSYEGRTAAHLDLSPRATTVMSRAGSRQKFCDMVAGDLHWLFELLPFAPHARLVLVAGSIIKPDPESWQSIVSYLTERAERHNARIEGNAKCRSNPLQR